MDEIQKLANQLEWCMETETFLDELNLEMRTVSHKYQSMMNELGQQGYIYELLGRLVRMQNEFQSESEVLLRYIEDEHQGYINKQNLQLQNALEKYMES